MLPDDTGIGKTDITPKTPSDLCFAGTLLSMMLAGSKYIASCSSELGWQGDGCRLKAESLNYQTTPGSTSETFTISRYGAKESVEKRAMNLSFKTPSISNGFGIYQLIRFP